MNKLKSQYFIELECINEDNKFNNILGDNLKLGEIVYATGWAASDYTHNINTCNVYDDIETAIINAKEVYKVGIFKPRLKEIIRKEGNYIDFCLED